jgi:hypothetical protein
LDVQVEAGKHHDRVEEEVLQRGGRGRGELELKSVARKEGKNRERRSTQDWTYRLKRANIMTG